jgi:2-keto-4-pentenoate hydratase/2-oxohepta-3-ene-1,7-dioic acid hydratase in catechol pathway
MRLVTFQSPTGPRVASVRDGQYVDLNRADQSIPHCIKALLAQGPEGLRRAAAASQAGEPFAPTQFPLLPIVPNPEKIFGVGLNYADHARETGKSPPAEPVIFGKLPSAIAADGQPIVLPPASAEVDYEAELVAVIGVGGRFIAEDRALEHVAGYCCGNDVSARDWQQRKPGGQWLLGKSFDTFAPVGPALVTADEIPNAGRLAIELRLNGRVMQRSCTDQLLFSVARLVAYVSQVCTLAAGDLLFTGTPPGVGVARKPPVFLRPGDQTEVEIARIGVLRNPVVAQEPG